MSKLTHSICEVCWYEKRGATTPVRIRDRHIEKCCFCGDLHASGIFVRAPLEETKCNGEHEEKTA